MDLARKTQHLHSRAGFGVSPREWPVLAGMSIPEQVDMLFESCQTIDELKYKTENKSFETLRKLRMASREERQEFIRAQRRETTSVRNEWIMRMANPAESGLLEKMVLFWHGHFACQVRSPQLAITYLNTLRRHALGDFRSLVLGVAKDPSMIRYLNNQQNRKESPNENFARELMELFTLGRGQYSEGDIKEAARAFTGWSSTIAGEFVFRTRQHDFGRKTFRGNTGNHDGDDIIDIILEDRQCAQFIAGEIYSYFVDEEVDAQIVSELGNMFYDNGYRIDILMREIFSSEWFYSDQHSGSRIRSPVELIAALTKIFDVSFEDDRALNFLQRALGQELLNPPNVAGWPGGRAWIDNATLNIRLNLINILLNTSEVEMATRPDLDSGISGERRRDLQVESDLSWLELLIADGGVTKAFDILCTQYLVGTPGIPKELLRNIGRSVNPGWKLASIVFSSPEFQIC